MLRIGSIELTYTTSLLFQFVFSTTLSDTHTHTHTAIRTRHPPVHDRDEHAHYLLGKMRRALLINFFKFVCSVSHDRQTCASADLLVQCFDKFRGKSAIKINIDNNKLFTALIIVKL